MTGTAVAHRSPIPERTRQAVIDCYGAQGRRALEAVEAGSVKKYLDFLVVVGTGDEYVVDDEFCSCHHVLFRGGFCWHQLAARLACLTGNYEEYDLWYHESFR